MRDERRRSPAKHIMNKWITRSRKFWNLPKKIKFPTISKKFRNRGTKTKSMWKCDKLRGLPLGKYVCIFKICNFPLHDKYAQNPNFSCSNAVRKIRAILSKYGSTSQSYPRRSAVRRKPIMLPLILRYYLYLCLCLCFLYFILCFIDLVSEAEASLPSCSLSFSSLASSLGCRKPKLSQTAR